MTAATWTRAHASAPQLALPQWMARSAAVCMDFATEARDTLVEMLGSVGLQMGASDTELATLPGALRQDIDARG